MNWVAAPVVASNFTRALAVGSNPKICGSPRGGESAEAPPLTCLMFRITPGGGTRPPARLTSRGSIRFEPGTKTPEMLESSIPPFDSKT